MTPEPRKPIPVSTPEDDRSVWGVVTWEDVDPRIDFFTVDVKGLSSAYRWEDPEGAFKAGDKPATGRKLTQKTLQLNFWRPGDEFTADEQPVYLGHDPKNSEAGKVDYQWIFR